MGLLPAFWSKTSPVNKAVAVIGGGYAGTAVAKALDATFNVTLIAKQSCLVHNVAGLRGSVVPGFQKKCLIPLDKLLTRGKLITGVEATKVDSAAKTVTLSSGESLQYDYLVIATGSLGPKTFGAANTTTDVAAMEALFKERQDAIAAAERILIIGGGPVGMETAGEIAAHYGTTKKVTLVAAKGLMEDPNTPFSDKFKTAIKSKLESVGVTVAVNAGHVDLSQATTNDAGLIVGPATYKWQTGEGEFDLAIPCIGSRIVPPLIAASGWEDKLDGGSLKVNSNLQVDGCDGTVFALGDIAALKETKLAYYAGIQAALTAQNIKAAEASKPLKAYTLHTKATSMVPVGPNLGAAEMNGMHMGNFPVKMLKGKALFVPPTWAGVGASSALAALK